MNNSEYESKIEPVEARVADAAFDLARAYRKAFNLSSEEELQIGQTIIIGVRKVLESARERLEKLRPD